MHFFSRCHPREPIRTPQKLTPQETKAISSLPNHDQTSPNLAKSSSLSPLISRKPVTRPDSRTRNARAYMYVRGGKTQSAMMDG